MYERRTDVPEITIVRDSRFSRRHIAVTVEVATEYHNVSRSTGRSCRTTCTSRPCGTRITRGSGGTSRSCASCAVGTCWAGCAFWSRRAGCTHGTIGTVGTVAAVRTGTTCRACCTRRSNGTRRTLRSGGTGHTGTSCSNGTRRTLRSGGTGEAGCAYARTQQGLHTVVRTVVEQTVGFGIQTGDAFWRVVGRRARGHDVTLRLREVLVDADLTDVLEKPCDFCPSVLGANLKLGYRGFCHLKLPVQ